MKRWKSICILFLVFLLVFQAVIPALADTRIPEGMDERQWERLTDDCLEYDEIEDRIVHFGSAYLSVQQELNKNYVPYETAVNELSGTIRDSRSALKDAKEDGDAIEIAYNQAILGAEEDAKKAFEKVTKIIRGNTDRVLNTTVKGGLVMNTENLMITYYRLSYALELLDASAELAEAAYWSVLTQKSLGMATDADILAAEDSLLTARLQQQTTRNQQNQIKQNLHMLTGWDYDAGIELGPVPEPLQSRIGGMNPEADCEAAIGNNYTLSNLRHNPATGALAKQNRLEKMEEMEEQIKAGVNRSYTNVLTAGNSLQAAASAYESAALNFAAAGRQYQLGMLGELQYQQMKVGYLAEKMNYENARLDLFQAMETYDWAVAGQLALD